MDAKTTVVIAGAVFTLVTSAYLLSLRATFRSIDEISMVAAIETLTKTGQFTVNQLQWTRTATAGGGIVGRGGQLYLNFEPGQLLMAAPLYFIGEQIDSLGAVTAVLSFNCFITAGTAALVLLYTRRLGYSTGIGIAVALAYAFGTSAWPYAKSFFREPLTGFFLLLSAFVLLPVPMHSKRRTVLAGLAFGAATVTKITSASIAAIYVFFIFFRLRGKWGFLRALPKASMLAGIFVLSIAPFVLLLQGYQQLRLGEPFHTARPIAAQIQSWEAMVSSPLWEALCGLLFSSGRGLFVYSPMLLLGLLFALRFIRRHGAIAWLTLGPPLLFLLQYATWGVWWGGLGWGPRFLVPVLPFLAIALAPLFEAARRNIPLLLMVCSVALASVGIQFLGVSTDYAAYIREITETYDAGRELLLFDARFSPILGQLQLLDWGNLDFGWAWRPPGSPLPVDGLALFPLVPFAWAVAGLLYFGQGTQKQTRTRWSRVLLFAIVGAFLLGISAYASLARLETRFKDQERGMTNAFDLIRSSYQHGDGIITLMPFWSNATLNATKALPPPLGLLRYSPPLPDWMERVLREATDNHQRLWVMANDIDTSDPENGVEEWLSRHAYKVDDGWHGDYRLALYVTGHEPMTRVSLDVNFSDVIALEEAAYAAEPLRAGDAVPVALRWRALAPTTQDLTVFLHLDDDRGCGWAGRDSPPRDGYRPTSTWRQGEMVEDRRGLVLPKESPPGEYRLVVGLYEPKTLERFSVVNAEGAPVASSVDIGRISVVAGREVQKSPTR